MINEYVGVASV